MATKTKIEPLKGARNWNIWCIRIKALLAKDDLSATIKLKKEFSKGTPKDEIEEYTAERSSEAIKASAIIRLNLGDSPLIQTATIAEDDAEALYRRLESLYSPKGFSTEFILAKELFETTLAGCGNNVENYFAKIRRYTDEIELRKKAIRKAIIAAFALNNLTDDYSAIIAAITTKYRDNDNDNDIDLDDLFNAIIDESRRLKKKEPTELAMAIQSNSPQKNSTIRCFNCGKRGHIARKCTSPKEASETKPKGASREEGFVSLTAIHEDIAL